MVSAQDNLFQGFHQIGLKFHLPKKLPNHKIIDNGEDFTEKEETDCVKYIQQQFSKYGRTITYDLATLMSQIVGRKRSIIASEVEKLCITAPKDVTEEFILENCFPINQDAILYKFGNVVDGGSLVDSFKTAMEYIENGIHQNVLVEILAKKARWQLAVCYLWSKGLSWYDIEQKIIWMGRFPSKIWHDDAISLNIKKKCSEDNKEPDSAYNFFTKELYIPSEYFGRLLVKGAKVKAGESLPMPFLAQLVVQFVRDKIVSPNSSKYTQEELKKKVLDRAISVYLKVTDHMKEMRYNNQPDQELYEMIRALVDYRM